MVTRGNKVGEADHKRGEYASRHAPATPPAEEVGSGPVTEGEPPAAERGKEHTVLAVNDSPDALELMSVLLRKEGYRVLTASDGREGFEVAQAARPNLIVSDVLMPYLDGIEMCRLIRKHPALRSTPLLLVSAVRKDRDSVVEGLKAGADDYLEAPYDPELLVAKVDRLIECRQTEVELRLSEERYRAFIENSSEAVWLFELDVPASIDLPEDAQVEHFYKHGYLAECNDAMAQMYGLTQAGELFGIRLAQFLPPSDPHNVEYLRAFVQAGYRLVDAESREQDREGNPKYFLNNLTGIIEDGQLRRAWGSQRDITERKRVEQDLRKSEERYRDLVENALDIIYTHDLEGNYTSINKAVERVTGYTREEALRLSLKDTVAPECMEKVRRMIAEKLAGEKETFYDLEMIRKDGRRIAVEVNTRLILQDGVPVGVQGIARDITERRRVEEMQLRRAAQVALRANINAALAKSNTPLQLTLERCAQAIGRHLDAAFARIWTLNKDENMLELQASAGMYTQLDGPPARVRVGDFKIGRIAAERRAHTTGDLQNDPLVGDREWVEREDITSYAGYPLIVEDRLVGVMETFSREKLADDTLDVLASVADLISQGVERKRAEEALRESEVQLRQSQKLEAIGQLAGGVAHDFNNLLTVITGYSDILMRQFGQDDPARLKLEEIRKAAERAASLTSQLLAFSRKQVLQPKVLNMNAIVADVDRMLRRLIGEDIDLLTVLEPALGHVKADPGQVEQVVVNLAVNARDAMPQGGKLTVETANVYLDNEYAGHHVAVRPGHYVMIAVSDTGVGMDAATQAHIFEPFFTTKEQGKGTGLGLSTVYGIVRQSGGSVWVYSEVGRGTTFKVYLPRVDETAESVDAHDTAAELPKGHETVLLTEDEEQVRWLTRSILEANGYVVLEAGSGDEALAVFKEHEGEVELLITDVVMPGMSGPELARNLAALRPGVKALFMSGYTDDAIVRHGLLGQEIAFLQKPFTPDSLMRKVREVLDASDEE